MPSSIDILSEAIQILGPPVKIEEHRGWAIWWCPFHQDAARSGKSKRANFGINFATDGGYWKCLRCLWHGQGDPSAACPDLGMRRMWGGHRSGCECGPQSIASIYRGCHGK